MKDPEKISIFNQCLFEAFKKSFTRRELIVMGIIIGVALLLRVLVILPGWNEMPEHFSRPDTPGYVQPALGLASCWGYAFPGSLAPSTARPPGFPAFLAVFFKLFGIEYGPPILALCLVGALTCIPVFVAGRYFSGSKIGYIAAALQACNITAVANSPMLLSDTLYAFFTAWQLYFFTRFYFKKDIPCFYHAMILAGLGTLIRPIGSIWVIPGVFLCLIQPGIRWPHKFGIAAIGTALFLCMIFPWMARNKAVGAGFSIDANTGAMYHQNGAMLLSSVNGTSYEAEKQQILKTLNKEFADHKKYPDTASQQQYRIKKFRELVMSHPFTYLTLHFQPAVLLPDAPRFFELMGLTTGGRGTLDVIHRKGIIAGVKHYFGDQLWLLLLLIPALLIPALTYAGCLAQLITWICRKQIYLIFFFLAFVEYFFFLPGPITVPRYQLPALPLMTIMAAVAISAWTIKLKEYYCKKYSRK